MRRWFKAWWGPGNERGTAFITTLFIVTLMAIVSVELVEASRFAVHRTTNSDTRDQAYWYAMGAREYALNSLQRSGQPARPVMRSQEPWVMGPRVFTLDNGTLVGGVKDQNNCVNLNAFVQSAQPGEDQVLGIDAERTQAMFTYLAEHLGLAPNVIEPLKAQIVDWIDADTRPEPGGAEDETYRLASPPYRAANQGFVEKEELLALPAMTPQIYALIEGWVCVLPHSMQPPLNINTLQPDQAILLSALTGRQLRVSDAENLLQTRPAAGYDSLDAFQSEAVRRQSGLEDLLINTVTLRSQWFEINVAIDLGDMPFTYEEMIHMAPNGQLTRITHRFGALQ